MINLSIYTGTGDEGKTSLFGGSRIGKDSLRVGCYGTIDEANSVLGVTYSLIRNPQIKKEIRRIQKKMFWLGAQLASDGLGEKELKNKIKEKDVNNLENIIDKYESEITPKNDFLIPGTTQSSSSMHVARTVVRRSERLVVALAKQIDVDGTLIRYLNRLSDALFIMARVEEEFIYINKVKNEVLERLGYNYSELNLDIAKKMAESVEIKAREIGIPIVFSVVDLGGNLVLLHRMDESLLGSIDISIDKAYTALAFKMPTDKISELIIPGNDLYGLQYSNRGRVTSIGGGYPLRCNNKIIGGIGVSGGTVAEDMDIALSSLEVFKSERS